MGVFYETIPDSLRPWIHDQKMLWVGSAPLSAQGHINISPKGGQAFGVLSPTKFWFMDLTGSGIETTSHLHEPGNGRICVMFIAFEGPPRIVRIWGTGRVIENGTGEFDDFVEMEKGLGQGKKEAGSEGGGGRLKVIAGTRSVIVVDVHQCATSCGFSVPFYEFKGWRSTLDDLFAKKEKAYKEGKESESMDNYWAYKSQLSIDGLPGMKRGYAYAQANNVAPLRKMVGKWAPNGPRTAKTMEPIHMLLALVLGVIIGVAGAVTMVSPETVRWLQESGS